MEKKQKRRRKRRAAKQKKEEKEGDSAHNGLSLEVPPKAVPGSPRKKDVGSLQSTLVCKHSSQPDHDPSQAGSARQEVGMSKKKCVDNMQQKEANQHSDE